MHLTLTSQNRRSVVVTILVLASSALSTGSVYAQQGGAYPEKPITWIVGWPAGGSADTATRVVARKLESILGQPIVVENRAGASGSIALQAAARAAADGYTLITVPGPVVSSRPVPQTGKELTGVATLGVGPAVLVGTLAEPMPKTVKELVASAKAQPQKYNYVSSGNGTAQHMAGELFNQIAGTTVTHIPYKGGSQAVIDVIGGQVNLGVLGITAVLSHISSGKLTPYAVTTATRSKSLPDVPTMAEAGLQGFEATQWFIVATRAGTPAQPIQKVNAGIAAVLKDPDVVAAFEKVGMEPKAAAPEETTSFVMNEQKRWNDLVQKAGLTVD